MKYMNCVIFKKVFPHSKSKEANGPQGVANLDPRDMLGRTYVGDHLTLFSSDC